MAEPALQVGKVLVVSCGGRIGALPLHDVIETMRPLPVERVAGAPSFVEGVAIIRGVPTPVVDLGAVLGKSTQIAGRFVTLRVDDRQVAFSVSAVLGVRDLNTITTITKLPPLLQYAVNDVVESIAVLDARVLMLLRSGWEVPDQVWQTLTTQEVAS